MMDSHRKNDENLAWDIHAWDFLIYFWSRIDLSFLVLTIMTPIPDTIFYDYTASDGTSSELIASDDDNAMVHWKCT